MNKKIKIKNSAFIYPMPMVLVGVKIENKPNFMAVGWVTCANYSSPKIVVSLNNFHHTNKGILEHNEFSINIPSADLVVKADYCGLVSGKDQDKSEVFDLFYGELDNAPMIEECPINIECKLVKTVDLEADTLFVGEIINTYTEEKYMSDKKPDITKMHPFTLTMPDNNYWHIGDWLAKAWDIGKQLK